MRPSTLIVAAVAVVFGLVAAVAAQFSLRQGPDDSTEDLVTLAVAKDEIPSQAPLDIIKFKQKQIAKEALGPNDILWEDLEERLKGDKRLTTKMTIPKDAHLQEFMLGDDLTIHSVLRPGFRAVSIPVRDESSAIGGWAQPGNFVDVQWIYRHQRGSGESDAYERTGGAQVNTLLRNVKILAMGNVLSSEVETAEDGSREQKRLRHVTLECTPEGAKKLRLAAEMGELALTLRSLEEDATAEEEDTPAIVNMHELLGDTGATITQPEGGNYRDELAELERRIQQQIEQSREKTLEEMQFSGNARNTGRDIPIVGPPPPAGFENSLLRIRTLRGAQTGELMIYVPSNNQ